MSERRRKILALKFRIEPAKGGKQSDLIAWIQHDGNGKHLVPAHPYRTLMQMRAGGVVIFERRQFVMKRLKPFRTNICRDETEYDEIESVEAWEAEG